MLTDTSPLIRMAAATAAAASVACGSSDEAAPRGFRHVDGEFISLENGTIRLGQDGYGVELMVLIYENPTIVDCRRVVFGPCTVMTCTRPADTDVTINSSGLIHLEWGSAALDVPTYGDIGSYALHPSPPWAAGETLSFTADFALGPPIDEKLVAPPLLVLKRPDFEPSFNGAPDAWGVTLDTSRDLNVEWEPTTIGAGRRRRPRRPRKRPSSLADDRLPCRLEHRDRGRGFSRHPDRVMAVPARVRP